MIALRSLNHITLSARIDLWGRFNGADIRAGLAWLMKTFTNPIPTGWSVLFELIGRGVPWEGRRIEIGCWFLGLSDLIASFKLTERHRKTFRFANDFPSSLGP
jgi:hypothetical protein